MYICRHVFDCICICMYMYMYVCMYACMYVYIYVNAYHVYMCVCFNAYMVYVFLYACKCVYVYMYRCMDIYVYMYTFLMSICLYSLYVYMCLDVQMYICIVHKYALKNCKYIKYYILFQKCIYSNIMNQKTIYVTIQYITLHYITLHRCITLHHYITYVQMYICIVHKYALKNANLQIQQILHTL